MVTVPDLDCSADTFYQVILAAFPKLEEGGGYELLRCKQQSRDLMLIGPRLSSSPRLLKRRVGNGRVYIRPIQRDLSLEEEEASESIEGVSEREREFILKYRAC